MRHASLFSGIGGFDLAAQWMGWENVFQVEIDGFCQRVLEKNFPNVKRYGDIKQFNGTEWAGKIDILTGGFPCQPYSVAGKRKGTEDSRHLWPEMLRVVGEIQPRFIVGENVVGLVNWSRGMVFEQVQNDLENKGYQVQSFILPACSKDAGHKRERVWITAHINSGGLSSGQRQEIDSTHGRINAPSDIDSITATDFDGLRVQRKLQKTVYRQQGIEGRQTQQQFTDVFRQSDTFEPKLCRSLHGIPFGVDRIKSLGNAIVPQVAFEIFKAIEHANQNL